MARFRLEGGLHNHSKFLLIRHDLIVDFDLFMSRLKVKIRREDCVL
jgi:hypothetical protein